MHLPCQVEDLRGKLKEWEQKPVRCTAALVVDPSVGSPPRGASGKPAVALCVPPFSTNCGFRFPRPWLVLIPPKFVMPRLLSVSSSLSLFSLSRGSLTVVYAGSLLLRKNMGLSLESANGGGAGG